MKKLIILIPAIILIAAACNKQAAVSTEGGSASGGQPGQNNSTDQTANWKTYTNARYGFEIQLPADWQVEEDIRNNSVHFNSPEDIKVIEEDKNSTENRGGHDTLNIAIGYIDDMVKEVVAQGKILNSNKLPSVPYSTLQEFVKLEPDFINPQYITFAGHDAFAGKYIGMFTANVIYVQKDNHLYEISSGINAYGMDLQLNQKILSTFKFTK